MYFIAYILTHFNPFFQHVKCLEEGFFFGKEDLQTGTPLLWREVVLFETSDIEKVLKKVLINNKRKGVKNETQR